MKEISMTTKQLREQMSEVVATLEGGTSIKLTYRRRPIGVIMPADAMPSTAQNIPARLRDLEIE